LNNLIPEFKSSGRLQLLTDLSPVNVCSCSIDPTALVSLANSIQYTTISHLPRVHAKVYVADARYAIITSGNFTAGGLFNNYEYGVRISDPAIATMVHDDVSEYAGLGGDIDREHLLAYCDAADRVRESLATQQQSIRATARREFGYAMREAENQLLHVRLAGGAIHTVFERTILYLLHRSGPMKTEILHDRISHIHPDLCDNSVDRIIGGKSFGKKWKHAIRTAQQNLKKKMLIEYRTDSKQWAALA
jgi:hypothetical protein